MNPWVEAMRLRTLPVSVAGVLAGTGCAVYWHVFSLLPMIICLVFAVVAQIASNFANEYYDFRNGLDKKGREGYRRGVTEGDISPESMKRATFLLLAIDALIGCTLIYYGGWWLIAVGVAVAIFAMAYSTGPYPLSHHGLGDVAVVIFFGFVPVTFTEYVQTGVFRLDVITLLTSLAVGLMAANVLIVNNYRDYEDDREVGKHTTVVIFGRKVMAKVYFINGIIAAACMLLILRPSTPIYIWPILPPIYYLLHEELYRMLRRRTGSGLNDVLKFTSILLLAVALCLLVALSIWPATAADTFH